VLRVIFISITLLLKIHQPTDLVAIFIYLLEEDAHHTFLSKSKILLAQY